MKNKFKIMKKNVVVIFKLFSSLGIILLLIAGYLYYKSFEFKKTALKTTGKVVELVTHHSSSSSTKMYAPKVNYFISGKKYFYVSNTSTSSPLYQVGKKVIVFYDPKNISNIEIEGLTSYAGILFLSGMGLMYLLIGIIPLYLNKRKKEKNEWLKQHGRKIKAQCKGVAIKNVYQVNRTSAYAINAQFLDVSTNKLHNFQSDDIGFDPTPFVQTKETIDVMIANNNFKKYWVDISFLPQEG